MLLLITSYDHSDAYVLVDPLAFLYAAETGLCLKWTHGGEPVGLCIQRRHGGEAVGLYFYIIDVKKFVLVFFITMRVYGGKKFSKKLYVVRMYVSMPRGYKLGVHKYSECDVLAGT